MKTPTITVDGRTGCVFEGEQPETYCFVPEDCLLPEVEGVRVLEGDYVRSRWDLRNMRCNDAGEGQHLFPKTQNPVVDFNSDLVRIFLRRIGGAQYS